MTDTRIRLATTLALRGYVQSARALVRRETAGVVVIEVNPTKAVKP